MKNSFSISFFVLYLELTKNTEHEKIKPRFEVVLHLENIMNKYHLKDLRFVLEDCLKKKRHLLQLRMIVKMRTMNREIAPESPAQSSKAPSRRQDILEAREQTGT
ncbi:hypothetical protein Bpfe_005488 [Biomphalaria pfeifferi]|uniref:Uncharacterized protein n=1 Tax=Biomphalaria pfeifferi TaxID=112525 RepID=A0AAD8C2C8_BIOPF|nr:hypothetical protein Bpfe_005488 [Biomphalaria pfeifferi]